MSTNIQSSQQKSVRIGMLSFAHGHAYSYATSLAKLPGVEIAGTYDADAERGRAAAARFGTTFYADPETLLDQELDGVVICSENVYHAPLVHLAAEKTSNILCEKPLATTVADAQAMIDHCRATGTRLQTAFPVRFSPAMQQLKALLDRQELGKVYSVKCTNHGSMPGGWFCDRALSGGGAVIDHTVHVIDLLRWLTFMPRSVPKFCTPIWTLMMSVCSPLNLPMAFTARSTQVGRAQPVIPLGVMSKLRLSAKKVSSPSTLSTNNCM